MTQTERTFLIVDDEALPRKLLTAHLTSYGTCASASSPQEGLTMFGDAMITRPYDIVFLDILMPGMDGLEVLRRLRTLEKVSAQRRGHHIPIIMVTGVEDLSMVKAAYTELCDGYLTKPVQAAKLHKLLEEILVGRRS